MNGDTLWVWCYPSVDSGLRQVLLRKCCLTQDGRNFHTFVFGQFCRTWYYITTVEVQEPTALNKVQSLCSLFRPPTRDNESTAFLILLLPVSLSFKVTHFSIVITAKDFNPEKYAALNRILCRYSVKCRQLCPCTILPFKKCVFMRVVCSCLFLQDVHQTWQPGTNDGGLCHRPHQGNLP